MPLTRAKRKRRSSWPDLETDLGQFLLQSGSSMHRINSIHQPLTDFKPARDLRAVLASCLFHGLVFCLLLGVTLSYRSHLPLPRGSPPAAPSISLETIILPSPEPEPEPVPLPSPTFAPPSVTPVAVAAPTPLPLEPIPLVPLPKVGLPVLPLWSNKPRPATRPAVAKTQATNRTPASPASTAPAQETQPATSASFSSYAPGPDELPHPTYPPEARDRGETGTVILSVEFDAQGNVARAEVAQSSGVLVLDNATRSFAYAHWHCPAYAGQIKMQPVIYSLDNL